jgi:chromosome segregation ATPase
MVQSLVRVMDERDKRYSERDVSNKEAVGAALANSRESANATEAALKEYKLSANEWRDTVKDLVATMPTKSEVLQQGVNLTDKLNALRSDIDHQIASLGEKVEDLRESRGESSGQMRGTRFLKAESQANVAIFVSVVAVLIMLWRVMLGR